MVKFYSIIFLFSFSLFCPCLENGKALLFQSSFECGRTLLQESFQKGGKKLTLAPVVDLDAWPETGGTGWVLFDAASSNTSFTYSRKSKNILYGVSGLEGSFPRYTEVLTAGFSEWDDISQSGINLHTPGIHGPAAVKFSVLDKSKSFYLGKIIAPCDELFVRFYIQFSKQALLPFHPRKLTWFFETLSENDGFFRIGLYNKGDKPVFTFRFHLNRDLSGKVQDLDVYIKDTLKILPNRPYCVEGYYRISETDGQAKLWVDGRLAGSREKQNNMRHGKKINQINIGVFSWARFLQGTFIMDDIAVSPKRIGPIPRIISAAMDSLGSPSIGSPKENDIIQVQMRDKTEAFFPGPLNSGLQPFPMTKLPFLNRILGGKTYFWRIRIKNPFGQNSPWFYGGPFNTVIQPDQNLPDMQAINTLSLKDTQTGSTLDNIKPGQWFDIAVGLEGNNVPSVYKRMVIFLSHFLNMEGSPYNDGGPFREKSSYYYRLDLINNLLWVKFMEGGHTNYEVSGQKHKYVQGPFSLNKNIITLRCRMSEKALMGPWQVTAFATSDAGVSIPYSASFHVGTDFLSPSHKLPSVKWLGILGIVILLVLPVLIILLRKKAKADVQPDALKSYVDQSMDIIRSEYSDPDLSMQKVAHKLNISRSHLSNQFKKETGKSFPQYLTDIRLEKAKELLKTTNMRISEIAFKVGYSSYEYFNSAFTKALNISPGDFRKKTQ
jgi:AraC-like DNA-binding protein